VPSVVPRSLACVAGWLHCPVCSRPLAATLGALICARGHSYDVARHGYVSLLPPRAGHAVGDDPGMVLARARVEDAGHLEPLTSALAETAGTIVGVAPRLVLDVGAGTGRHLAGVLGALPGAAGVALDASRSASRLAARAHPSGAAVRADAWHQVPLGDRTVDLALSVFAPRNGLELARVLRPGAALIVVSAASSHLQELRSLHTIGIDPNKSDRLSRQLSPWFRPANTNRIAWTLKLAREQAAAVLGMGPAARHLKPDFNRRLNAFDEPILLTAAADLRVYRRDDKAPI
jgi:23S rRNA (guanine745-N1)-methyltransferase